MSTYSLTGSGTQALSAGTGALRVSVTHIPTNAGFGRANPVNYYDLGLLRQGDGTDWWRTEAIDAEHMLVPLLQGMTEIGYALLNGATIDVVEVIGTSPFYQPPASPGSALLDSFEEVLTADVTGTGSYADLLTRSCAAGGWIFTAHGLFSIDSQCSGATKLWDGSTTWATGQLILRTGTDVGLITTRTRLVTLPTTTTIKLSGILSGANGHWKAQSTQGAAGNTATRLLGERYV